MKVKIFYFISVLILIVGSSFACVSSPSEAKPYNKSVDDVQVFNDIVPGQFLFKVNSGRLQGSSVYYSGYIWSFSINNDAYVFTIVHEVESYAGYNVQTYIYRRGYINIGADEFHPNIRYYVEVSTPDSDGVVKSISFTKR